jgi:predicted alpha/beta hydrolase family esterase
MSPVLLVPGIQNSGPAHWQSLWEARHPGVQRVQQRDWDHPEAGEWVAALDAAVQACAAPPVVVAHSLGCLVAARWAAASPRPVKALVLVAVPDPAGPSFPTDATGFTQVPPSLPGRQVVLVSSQDDPYASPAFTARCAAAWQAGHHDLGARGHLNAASGLGDWPQGWAWVSRWR